MRAHYFCTVSVRRVHCVLTDSNSWLYCWVLFKETLYTWFKYLKLTSCTTQCKWLVLECVLSMFQPFKRQCTFLSVCLFWKLGLVVHLPLSYRQLFRLPVVMRGFDDCIADCTCWLPRDFLIGNFYRILAYTSTLTERVKKPSRRQVLCPLAHYRIMRDSLQPFFSWFAGERVLAFYVLWA